MSSIDGACPCPKHPPDKPKKKPRKPKSPSAPKKRRRNYEDGGGIDDDGEPNPVPEPVLFACIPTKIPPGPSKVDTLVLRHSVRASLWNDRDAPHVGPIDFVKRFAELAQFMREACLAERGVRWLADGISVVPGPKPGDAVKYRSQIWDPGLGKAGDHIELGYSETRAEAVSKIADWAERYAGIPAHVDWPIWLQLCLKDAMEIQARQSEEMGGYGWDVG